MGWRDGTSNDSGNSQSTTFTLTIPGDVAAGDWVAFIATAVALGSSPVTLSATSTGTAPGSPAVTPVTGTEGLPAALTAAVWKFQASGTDAGKVITVTAGSGAFLGGSLGAWSGQSGIDVSPGVFGGANANSVTAPVAVSQAAGVTPVYMCAGAAEGSGPITAPSGGTLATRQNNISAAFVGSAIVDLNGQAGNAGCPLGGAVFSCETAANSMLAAFTLALRPATPPAAYSPSFVSTDGNGVQTWSGTTTLNRPYTYPGGSPTGIGLRILPPSSPNPGRPHGFLYVLPPDSGFDSTNFGNGLDTIRAAGLHNTYNLTLIELSFGGQPWCADNPQDAGMQLESFIVQTRDWTATSSFASGGEQHWLIGFSKTGIGGEDAILRHPDKFAGCASWDFPGAMTDYDGTDPTFGSQVGGSPAANYGNSANFQANYRLSSANLAAWRDASNFGTVRRLWIGGYNTFQADVAAYHSLLTSLGILHDYSPVSASAHNWAPTPAWIPAALASIITIPAITGTATLTMAALRIAALGTVLPPQPPLPPSRIWRPCYCNRSEVMRALDFAPGVDAIAATDRAMLDAAENIEGQLHRVFYPSDDTRFFDWPNQGESGGGQYADPWKLRLDDNDIACLATLVSGGVTIPLSAIFLRPTNNPQKGLPFFTHLELDRSQSFTFGNSAQTPQNSIAAAGTWGYGADADLAAYLADALNSSDWRVIVDNGSIAGPGDVLVLGYGRGDAITAAPWAGSVQPFTGERVVVTDVSPVATGLTQSGPGVSTEDTADCALAWTGTGTLSPGEVITLDQEDMLVEQVIGGTATVRRAFAGTPLQDHSAAAVYAYRQLAVLRAQLGTTAGTYAAAARVCRHRVPQLVRDLAIAESEVQLLNEGSAYARTVGSGESATPAPGIGLMDKWDEARTRHGRKGRHRGV